MANSSRSRLDILDPSDFLEHSDSSVKGASLQTLPTHFLGGFSKIDSTSAIGGLMKIDSILSNLAITAAITSSCSCIFWLKDDVLI